MGGTHWRTRGDCIGRKWFFSKAKIIRIFQFIPDDIIPLLNYRLWRKHSETLTLLGACRHAPAAGASPLWDIGIVPVEEITQFPENFESLYPDAPRPPTGDWWRKRGASYKTKRFSIERDFFISAPLPSPLSSPRVPAPRSGPCFPEEQARPGLPRGLPARLPYPRE